MNSPAKIDAATHVGAGLEPVLDVAVAAGRHGRTGSGGTAFAIPGIGAVVAVTCSLLPVSSKAPWATRRRGGKRRARLLGGH
ncbi:hypothetical protein ACU4HD_46970 [Cupriavidus basilensis]